MQNYEQHNRVVLEEGEAAQFLRVSIRTLQSWRVSGRGPRYIKLGRSVRYDRKTLIDWLDAQTRGSTSGGRTQAGQE